MEKKISGKHGNRVAVMKERMAAVVLASALLLGGGLTAKAQNTAVTTCSQSAATAIQQNPNWKANATEWQKLKGEITLYMTNDMGRNGYYDQKPIAELMGEMAGVVGPECVIAAGDIHHFNGVASTQDPLWLTNYEWVYSHPELMLDWFAVCGNHEYRGNTQAFMDYGKVSRRCSIQHRSSTLIVRIRASIPTPASRTPVWTSTARSTTPTRALRLLSIRRGTSTCSRVAPLSRAV